MHWYIFKRKDFIGENSFEGGPDGVFPANKLSKVLEKLNIKLLRFKTGTPARVNKNSIDFLRWRYKMETRI